MLLVLILLLPRLVHGQSDSVEFTPMGSGYTPSAVKTTVVPPMPEGIVAADGEIYLLSEAASNRYRLGKPLKLDWVYKTPSGYFQ